MDWIKCEERMPELPDDAPDYAMNVHVIACSSRTNVREMRYARNMYAKTEKGRAARWEEIDGRLAFSQPKYWMPMPLPPEEE